MTQNDKIIKRTFDFLVALLALLILSWFIIILIVLTTIDTKSFGLYFQRRIGQHATPFTIIKLKTMRASTTKYQSTVTTSKDIRVTPFGRMLRRFKLDELPQLVNVILGTMSFVGPRPDVPGYADQLEGEDRIILSVKPGITGPASLHFKNEEELLAKKEDPEHYNRAVIWPQKVAINKNYIQNYSITKDFLYIKQSILGT